MVIDEGSDVEKEIISCLKKIEKAQTKDIAKEIGITERTVSKHIKRLIYRNIVKVEIKGRKNLYSLIEIGLLKDIKDAIREFRKVNNRNPDRKDVARMLGKNEDNEQFKDMFAIGGKQLNWQPPKDYEKNELIQVSMQGEERMCPECGEIIFAKDKKELKKKMKEHMDIHSG